MGIVFINCTYEEKPLREKTSVRWKECRNDVHDSITLSRVHR